MGELISAAAAWPTAPYTFLLIVVVLYWLLVIFGLLDVEAPDIDLDVDVETGASSWGSSTMSYFNLGEVPLMIWASIAVLGMWVVSILTHYWLDSDSLLLAAALAPPNFILNAFIAKFVTSPLSKLFRRLEEDSQEHAEVVGKLARVKSGTVDDQFGQAEVPWDGAALLINVRTRNEETLHQGDDAIILEYLAEDDAYVVTGLETEA